MFIQPAQSVRDYIKKENLIIGQAYAVDARSFMTISGVSHAIWDGKIFHGVRVKWSFTYMFEEHHWDDGAPHGTVKPLYKLGLPDIREG